MSKTAEQINLPLTGRAESLSQKRRYSAICENCRAEQRQKLIEEIEKLSKKSLDEFGGNYGMVIMLSDKEFKEEILRRFSLYWKCINGKSAD